MLVRWKRIHPTGIFMPKYSMFINNFDRFSRFYCIRQIYVLYGIPIVNICTVHRVWTKVMHDFYAFHVSTVTCGPCFLAKSVEWDLHY